MSERAMLAVSGLATAAIEAGAVTAKGRATALWQQALAEYEEPVIDAGVRDALEDYVARKKAAAQA